MEREDSENSGFLQPLLLGCELRYDNDVGGYNTEFII